MIAPEELYATLVEAGVSFFVGVPDSLLKEFCAFADVSLPRMRHVIAVNEGTAVAIAVGTYLVTRELPLVYFQNSGLGNATNPLLSLADPEVYGIPVLLLIGWRGEPGVPDEPQHAKQGLVTPAMLDAMGIPYGVLNGEAGTTRQIGLAMARKARERQGPAVLLVRRDAFGKSEVKRENVPVHDGLLSRERAIEIITELLPREATVVSSTGHISRELYEQRVRLDQDRSSDFLTVGCMGHASQIALGIAWMQPMSPVVCLDGDGAALMHMGGLATIGTSGLSKFLHVILNNGVHDSVGGQPTVAMQISLTGVARACRYRSVFGPVSTESKIREAMKAAADAQGPVFIEVHVKPGARADLGRPKETPTQNKKLFMERLYSGRTDLR